MQAPRGSNAVWVTKNDLAQIARLLNVWSQDESTCSVARSQNGFGILVRSSASGTSAAPVQIVSGTGEDHVGNVFANGKNAGATESSVAVKVLQIAAGESIPSGTWLMAWKQRWAGAGESSSSSTGGTGDEFWTVDVPRWL